MILLETNSGPIFIKFSSRGWYLIVEDQFDPVFSDRSRDVVPATNFGAKLAI